MYFSKGNVYLDRFHFYKVGPISKEWKNGVGKFPGVVFENKKIGATIVTEAICGGAFEDLSLELLTQNLMAGLGGAKKIKKEFWQLSGREALYTLTEASLDGVPEQLEIVVLKKNLCEFDFYSIAAPQNGAAVSQAFADFVKGFEYK